ncbi:molybdopterin dinucleotide binding domain-containing protein, partial [Candidatus Riflebacteria bacterium]
NYLNTASIASLALLCGTGNRPGRMVARMGGHQRGGMSAAPYPLNLSPEKFPGRRRKPLDLDRWLAAGKVKFAWVVGCTWVNAMAGSIPLFKKMEAMTVKNQHQLHNIDLNQALATFKKRVDSGGLIMVEQSIYLTEQIGNKLADLILPAATWGECDFSRANGERRIRLYSKFMDPPGEAKPDWEIVSLIAKKMGFKGYDWKDSNEIFEEAARFGKKGILNYHPLVFQAKKKGIRGHDLLKSYGTEGIQAPIRLEGGKLEGTKRLLDSTLQLPDTGPEGPTVWIKKLTSFNSQHGKANFIKTPWSLFADFYAEIKPRDGEFWVINGRINEIWQSGFDDQIRRPYIAQRWPENFIELNPIDAEKLNIQSGDYVVVENDRLPIQVGHFMPRDMEDLKYAKIKGKGYIEFVKTQAKAVAIVTQSLRPGTTFMYFLNPKEPANSLVPAVPDPITGNYRYKLGFGKIRKTGESPYKKDLSRMSFASRCIG